LCSKPYPCIAFTIAIGFAFTIAIAFAFTIAFTIAFAFCFGLKRLHVLRLRLRVLLLLLRRSFIGSIGTHARLSQKTFVLEFVLLNISKPKTSITQKFYHISTVLSSKVTRRGDHRLQQHQLDDGSGRKFLKSQR
jgi:hypothetical protein